MNDMLTIGWRTAMRHKARRESQRRRFRAAVQRMKLQCLYPMPWALAWGACIGATLASVVVEVTR